MSITAASGSAIYYTTDGTAPVAGQGTTKQYVTALTLNSTTTVKAIATAPGDTNSTIATATYALIVAAPVITPGSESFSGTVSVSITDRPAAQRFTTPRTEPRQCQAGQEQYSTAFTLNSTATVNAIATAPGDTRTALAATATYTFVPSQPAAIPIITPKGGKISTTQPIIHYRFHHRRGDIFYDRRQHAFPRQRND